MNPFIEDLQRINQELAVAQPAKARIILELAADLEDLYDYYRNQGKDDAEAVRLAKEKGDLAPDVLSQLARVHSSGLQRILLHLSDRTRNYLERIGLAAVLLVLVMTTGPIMLSTGFLERISHFVWGPVVMAFAIAALSFNILYRLYIRRDHRVRQLRKGISTIFYAATASLVINIFGVVYELLWTINTTLAVIHRSLKDIDMWLYYFVHWVLRTSGTSVISLWIFILGIMLWYFLDSKVRRIEATEYQVLLELT